MIFAERELKPLVLNPLPNITKVRPDDGSEDKLFEFLDRLNEFGHDVETTPTKDFYWRRMRTMQFGNSNEQYVIDLKAYCDNSSDILYNCQGLYGANLYQAPKLKKLVERLVPYMCTTTKLKVGVNLGFEYECWYWMFGIRTYGFYDCMLAEKCIYAGLGGRASLKNYEFYSMEEMFERYFGMTIDKTLQTSFNLDDDLSEEQYEYAALDTRLPLSIKGVQSLIASGETPQSLKAKGMPKKADYLYYVDKLILGDKLHEIIKIENEAIGSFVDMHVHGERLDIPRWQTRVNKAKDKLVINLKGLDSIFLPIVGSKYEIITDEQIAEAEAKWKALNIKTDQEIQIRQEINAINREIRKHSKLGFETPELQKKVVELDAECQKWEEARKAQKEILKKECRELSKRKTKLTKLASIAEGDALINYGSDAQLLAVLRDPDYYEFFPKLFRDEYKNKVKTGNKVSVLENLDDETLEKYEEATPAMKLIREYHGLSKEIGTYGESWITQWVTKPCKEEGWMHPGDGRLHCVFNQYDAETGRSSSEKPNGQNLPQGDEVRGCFIADPPDESIRISECCQVEVPNDDGSEYNDAPTCPKCGQHCSTIPEEFVIVTADMSGAELRIIAEDSGDEQWIGAFERGEDLHSAGTELLYPDEWPKERLDNCLYYVLHDEKSLAKYPKAIPGTPKKEKCKCPLHKERRDGTKACNFLLAYGGGPATLAVNIHKTLKEAKFLMALHEAKNPGIWKYLAESGRKAAQEHKAFDLFGRRRILPEPTKERVLDNCQEWNEKKLRLDEAEAEKNIANYTQIKGKKPNQADLFLLTHRAPTQDELAQSYIQMVNSTNRQGKNMRIQGTNATIAKVAMGCGYCPDGKPFLWHTLPKYKAKLIKFVHDELVVMCPKRYGQIVADLIGDAFKRAAAIKMKRVVMEFDYAIASYWKK